MMFDPTGFEAASREVLTRLAVAEALPELLIQKGVISREEWNWAAAACRSGVERKLDEAAAEEQPPLVNLRPTSPS